MTDSIQARVMAAIKQAEEVEFFHDGLAGDLTGMRAPEAYSMGWEDATKFIKAALHSGREAG